MVLRQEKTLKVRLNMPVGLGAKDPTPHGEKAYMLVATDFSENANDGEMWQFCVKFGSKKIAASWLDAYNGARDGTATATKAAVPQAKRCGAV